MFIPETSVYLLNNVDITNEYNNTFSFSDANKQFSFFKTKVKYQINDVSYIRKDDEAQFGLYIEKNVEELFDCSYMMFQNSSYGNRWFYAFITDMRYENENTTRIMYEIDVMQTWKFDIRYEKSFIEREHVADDTRGLHIVDEGLDIGDVKTDSIDFFTELTDLVTIVATTQSASGADVRGDVYNGVYSGVRYYAFDSITPLNGLIDDITTNGQADAIISIFMMPKALIRNYAEGVPIDSELPLSAEKFIIKTFSDLDGYTPKNNKLYTFPYNFLQVTNFSGRTMNYKYEYFSSMPYISFKATSNLAPSPTVLCYPSQYKGQVYNYNESIELSNYPICSWIKDVYATWLAQNAVSAPLSIASSVLGTVAGVATGNAIGVASGVIGVAQSIGNYYEKSILPNTMKGELGGGTNIAVGCQTFGFTDTFIKKERAELIDNYFTKYGYKVNALKSFNFETRENWNFIKTIDANIFGNFPNKDLLKIRSIFNKGVTFWHNDNVGDYNRDNGIR